MELYFGSIGNDIAKSAESFTEAFRSFPTNNEQKIELKKYFFLDFNAHTFREFFSFLASTVASTTKIKFRSENRIFLLFMFVCCLWRTTQEQIQSLTTFCYLCCHRILYGCMYVLGKPHK